jgi:hypothetical protein
MIRRATSATTRQRQLEAGNWQPENWKLFGVFTARDWAERSMAEVGQEHGVQADASIDPGELTETEKRDRVIHLVFAGSRERYDEFVGVVRDAIPAGTGVVLRGSAVTGRRWKDGAPFDVDGPGTSDLDLTLVGDEALTFFKVTGFFVPGVHSRPLSDEDADIAPDLVPLRQQLIAMVNRPVNIQATRDFVMYLRGELIGQPYHTLIEKPQTE